METIFHSTPSLFTAGRSSDNVALLGAGLATKNDLSVGSTFQAYGTDFTVAGIFDTGGNRFGDSTLVAPLSTVQRVSEQPDAVTEAVAQVDSITNLEPTTAAIKTTLGDDREEQASSRGRRTSPACRAVAAEVPGRPSARHRAGPGSPNG